MHQHVKLVKFKASMLNCTSWLFILEYIALKTTWYWILLLEKRKQWRESLLVRWKKAFAWLLVPNMKALEPACSSLICSRQKLSVLTQYSSHVCAPWWKDRVQFHPFLRQANVNNMCNQSPSWSQLKGHSPLSVVLRAAVTWHQLQWPTLVSW